MRLYLIRHAESENNAKPEAERVEDPAITTRGHLQADCLGRWLQTLSIDCLLTSPFRRTLQTTRYATDRTGQSAEIWTDVFERGGCYRGWGNNIQGGIGCNRDQIIEHLPGAMVPAGIDTEGWWNGRPPESDAAALTRAQQVTQKFVDRFGNSNDSVVAIIHAEFKRHLLAEMLHGQADAEQFGPLCNVGITLLEHDARGWRLQWLNSVSHLPADQITGAKG